MSIAPPAGTTPGPGGFILYSMMARNLRSRESASVLIGLGRLAISRSLLPVPAFQAQIELASLAVINVLSSFAKAKKLMHRSPAVHVRTCRPVAGSHSDT